MDLGIAIDLAGGSLQDTCFPAAGQLENVEGAVNAGAQRSDGVGLIVSGRSRAGQIIDPVHRSGNFEGLTNIVSDELETGMVQKRANISHVPGLQIVNADDSMPLLDQPIAQ